MLRLNRDLFIYFVLILTADKLQLNPKMVIKEVIKKVTKPPKALVKEQFVGICFMYLMGYLGIFRKGHKVSALKF